VPIVGLVGEKRLSDHLAALGASFDDAIDGLGMPAWLVDTNGAVLWQNRAARELADERRVGHFIDGVAPESKNHAMTLFSRMLLGVDTVNETSLVVSRRNGERFVIEANDVAVRSGDKVVAVFGVGRVVPQERSPEHVQLAPRLHETLRLLAQGKSTDALAASLGITRESARNYVRHLLKALEVHSRVEAVARGRELGLI
jgi:DNA-binding CsgD family transcriptional regulator